MSKPNRMAPYFDDADQTRDLIPPPSKKKRWFKFIWSVCCPWLGVIGFGLLMGFCDKFGLWATQGMFMLMIAVFAGFTGYTLGVNRAAKIPQQTQEQDEHEPGLNRPV